MGFTSADDLLQTLAQHQLLTPRQLEAVAALPAASTGPKGLGQELLRRGWLTPFQIKALFHGRAAELVLGPYVLLEPLGEGGMGQLFKARHAVMNWTVALRAKGDIAHSF